MTIYSDGTLGQIYFADGNSGDDRKRGGIVYDHSQNELKFSVNAVEKFVIDSDGDVGIGTSAPTSKFDVHMNDKSGVNFLNLSNNSAIDLKSNQVESCGRIQVSESVNGGVMILSTKNTSGDLTERLRITSGGNIGINSTSPTHKLEVLGDSSLKGNLTVSGVLTATSFSGDGSNLTGVTTTGDVQDITGIATGIGTFISNAGSLTNIDSFAYASTDYKTAEYTCLLYTSPSPRD